MNKKWIAAILIYLGLIVTCCIALYAVPSVRGMLEQTYIAKYDSIDVTDEVSGFIVRDEKVYTAKQPSFIKRLAEPDKLVKAKTKVVELTPDEKTIEAEESAKAIAEEFKADSGTGDDAAAASEEAAEDTKSGEASGKKEKDSKDKDSAEKSDKDAEKASDKDTDKGKKDKDKDKAKGSDKDSDKTDKDKDKDSAEADEEEEDDSDTGKYNKIMEELGDSVKTTSKGKTRDAGYVSYYVDGAEARLTTDAIGSLTYNDYKDLTDKRAVEVPDKKCGKGYPVFKIVKNSKWYLVYYVDKEAAEKYVPGETVQMDINGEPVTVTVSQVLVGTDEARVTLSCKSFFDGFLEMRTLDTTVTVISASGLLLEDRSIVEAPDGKRGVFRKNKLDENIFVPVKVKADDGTKCVVYSDIYVDDEGNYVDTLSTYDEIVAAPTDEDMARLKMQYAARKTVEAGETGRDAARDAATEKAARDRAAAEKAAEEKAAEEAAKKAAKESNAVEKDKDKDGKAAEKTKTDKAKDKAADESGD